MCDCDCEWRKAFSDVNGRIAMGVIINHYEYNCDSSLRASHLLLHSRRRSINLGASSAVVAALYTFLAEAPKLLSVGERDK